MFRFSAAAAVVLALSGCAVPATEVSGPDGRSAYSLKCSGMGRSKEDCYKKAGELCPHGYSVQDDSSRISGFVSTGYALIPARQDYMLITCN